MSGTIASLRRKIDTAGDLRSVVCTMKALAASNIGQFEQSVRALADFTPQCGRSVELGLSHLGKAGNVGMIAAGEGLLSGYGPAVSGRPGAKFVQT